MLRVVLDTDVIVAALRSPRGASAAILRAATAGQVRLLSSVALVLEYEANCTLPLRYEAAELSHTDALIFVDTLAAAEKLAAIDTVRFFAERADRADFERFQQILNRPGGEPPQPGDELHG